MVRHGPRHGAQKSTNSAMSLRSACAAKLSQSTRPARRRISISGKFGYR